MAIVGLGTDLARAERFRRFVADGKDALLERLFTAGERAYSLAKADPAPHLAARFAAKEAGMKAFGLGWRDGLAWHDFEVVPDPLGRPDLVLAGRAAELAAARGVTAVHLSYSHDGDYAVATVILEGA
ncbi:MAG: holo-[acyl-carrier-protein] synthase [Deltaproteobacteria bacterium]|nr:MAG: holo-[acyl-carrier-protein] synthase [Deltaproteobacteria bacterium]